MVTVPVRSAPEFRANVRTTTPVPLPLLPDVTAIHEALDAAVHAQPASAVTVIEAVPPTAAIASDVRLSV
jgi:hypothetical protein